MSPVDIVSLSQVVGRLVEMMAPTSTQNVRPSNLLINDLGFQSLALVELAFTLEELFDLEEMVAEQTIGIETVEDITQFLRARFDEGTASFPDERELIALAVQYGFDWKPLS